MLMDPDENTENTIEEPELARFAEEATAEDLDSEDIPLESLPI